MSDREHSLCEHYESKLPCLSERVLIGHRWCMMAASERGSEQERSVVPVCVSVSVSFCCGINNNAVCQLLSVLAGQSLELAFEQVLETACRLMQGFKQGQALQKWQTTCARQR